MNRFLETIYSQWDDKADMSKEAKQVQAILCGSSEDIEETTRREDLIFSAVGNERTAAFAAGFYTAVELLMTGRG